MSNSQAQGSQGPPQQQQQQVQLLKADDLSKLQCLSDDQKQKYRPLLLNFWQMMQTKPAGTPEHTQASAKLREWSQKLIAQERAYRNKMKQQQQQQGQGQNAQNQAAQQVQQPPPPANPQQRQPQPAQPPRPQPAAQPQAQPQQQGNPSQPGAPNGPAVNPEIQKHVENFPYVLPPNGPAPGTAEAEKTLMDFKQNLRLCLMRQERARAAIRSIEGMTQQRKQSGQEIPPEFQQRKQQAEQEYNSAKRFVDEFRKRQQEWKNAGGLPAQGQAQQQAQPQAPQQQSPQPPAQNHAQAQAQPQRPPQNVVKPEPQIKVEGGQQPPPMQQFPNAQSGGVAQQMPQNQQMQASSAAAQQARPPPAPHSQSMPQPNQAQFAQQPPRPQINPQQANAHMQQQNNSPHPQSATSNAAGMPVPLSHQAAVSAAQRSYSSSDAQRTATPMQSGQGSFPAPGSREREQMNNPKMPIPRTLSVTQPAPVGMGQARPTMSGPTNGAPGPMGQPVITKFPPFQLEGEGDRVLSKRKLDELVRQVTGGSEDALTPEVEEAVLQLADEFVDTVVTHACKLAKLRESPNLEIRDLQLILERNYNIRIPGYASDEVRTVRKLVPAPGWTQKMNAVQAAKVMGGKTDI